MSSWSLTGEGELAIVVSKAVRLAAASTECSMQRLVRLGKVLQMALPRSSPSFLDGPGSSTSSWMNAGAYRPWRVGARRDKSTFLLIEDGERLCVVNMAGCMYVRACDGRADLL